MIVSVADIAAALGVSGQAIRKRLAKDEWQPEAERGKGGAHLFKLDNLPMRDGDRLKIRMYIAKSQPAPSSDATLAGGAAGKKLALATQVQQASEQRDIESGLAAPLTLPPREKQRDRDRSAILADWKNYQQLSGQAIKKSMDSYAIYYNAGQRQGLEEVHQRIPKVSGRTLYRWRQKVKQKGHLGAGFGNRKGHSKIDRQPELKAFVTAMLTVYPHSNSSQGIKALRARFADRPDISLPSQGRLGAWMDRWKDANAQLLCAVTNPDEWKNKYLAAFGSMSEQVVRLNQLWEFDGTPADIMFVDGRHSINGVIDVYSRRAKMYVTPTAKSTAVAAIIRSALLDWGVPEVAKTDNGSDYTSYHITRVIDNLQIDQQLCQPFCPWEKPHIERFFRTFAHDLVELLPGFIGHSVADRKAIEARKAFSDRLFKKDEVIEVNMTAAEFQKFADDWCNNIYHHNKHSELGKTPFQMFAEWNQPIKTISNERALDLLLAPAATKKGDGICTVTKGKAITINKIEYFAAELWEFIGQKVRVLEDPIDFGTVTVYAGENFTEYACIAKSVHTGIDRAEVAARAKALQKETIQQQRRELKAAARKLNVGEIAQEIMQHRAAEAGKLIALPKREEEHTSPALEAAAEAAQATTEPDNSRLVNRIDMLRKAIDLAETEQKALDAQRAQEAEEQGDDQRYQRWLDLDAKKSAGEDLGSEDQLFYAEFRHSAAFRTQQEMAEHFRDFYAEQA